MTFKEGELVLILYKEKRYIRKLMRNMSLSVKGNVVKFQDIIGRQEGEKVGEFFLLRPTLEDIILFGFRRRTQIVYPKDSFYIAFKLDVKKDERVLEFGIGSGAMTSVLSRLAGEVYAYEVSESFYKNALENWERFDLCKNVKAFNMDFQEANVEEEFFDACVVDVKEPWMYLDKVWSSLKKGRVCCFLLPTTNQVSKILSQMEPLFTGIEVLEILLRYYKANPERLRPQDQMTAHTAYIVFGRKRI